MDAALWKIDTSSIDDIIVGRVEPHIYAFSTETVPNYLKVGDTSRGVSVRLSEWRAIFPNLIQRYQHSAQIDDDTIFRDFAVHAFLEYERTRERLKPHTFDDLPYYSREFFKDATAEDVEAAISDIIQSAKENSGKYRLYSLDRLPQALTFRRTENYLPRDNQQQAIDNFKAAVDAGRTDLLLYAVMRFGKSFTSMCCAKEINARFVIIVSAKADVKDEWKKTVESHVFFADYVYMDSEALKRDENVITDTLSNPDKKIALFLTLQDLQGDEIKEKHKDVFARHIDLLIIDETHFGARGESYGKVLQEQRLSKSEIKKELKHLDGFETIDRVENAVKTFNAKIRLHLSGTPYRILMGNEFKKEDIIAFVRFSDIIDEQQRWNKEHLKDDDCNEWDNPYFGFPEMIRFAFHPNEASCKKMEQMRKNGITYTFSELFRPISMTVNAEGSHRQFKHESEILELMEVIDGSKADENLLGFLDYKKIKEGKMCRHIVCVLPFRASCDAMAALIETYRDKFKNLGDYEIVNIAGFDQERKYKSMEDIKRTIRECESRNRKTLTLTVNRMLTGATVPQWDTMLYLKNTVSPQEYDQAIFRLQNQYITTFKDECGKTIKYNMKPQTLLVDFDPNRMFILQEKRSQIYNFNTEVQGNTMLKARIAKELEISPIIILNKNKLQRATPANITDAVREYSRSRSIMDDATDIPVDAELLQDDNLLAIIKNIEPINARNGLKIKPNEGDGDDMEIPDETDNAAGRHDNFSASTKPTTDETEDDSLGKRLSAYYARILFFAFITKSIVKSLSDVIDQITATEDNQRISRNLGLNIGILKLIQRKSNPRILSSIDYKIENTNDLVRDEKMTLIERVMVAMRKFGRLSDSEIVTPLNVAEDMVKLLPEDVFSHGPILDIASKQGEFAIALLKRYGDSVSTKIYSVCTSKLAYEFTRKVYDLLSLPVDHIFDTFTSYDLIKKENNQYIIPREVTEMNFATIIGNPPYQINDGSGASDDAANPIYHSFVNFSKQISPFYISLIMPSKWMIGGKMVLKPFRKEMMEDHRLVSICDYEDSGLCFNGLHIDGGVCHFLWSKNHKGLLDYTLLTKNGQSYFSKRSLSDGNVEIVIRDNRRLSIIEKVTSNNKSFKDIVSLTQPYGIRKDLFNSPERYPESNLSDTPFEGSLKIYGVKGIKGGARRTIGYVSPAIVTKKIDTISKYKIFFTTSYSTNAFNPPEIIVGDKNTICTETFLLIGPFDAKVEQLNCAKYTSTNFFKLLLFYGRGTMQVSQSVFRFVPMQDFTEESDIDWSQSVADIDRQLYAKYGLTDDEIALIESMIKPM